MVRQTGLTKGSSIAGFGGSGNGKVSVMVPVTKLVSMLVSMSVRVGIRMSVRIQ